MTSQESVRGILKQFYGQANFVVVPRFFISMLGGDFNAAILLNQILYWSDRSQGRSGWFYKTYSDWDKEIALSKYQVRRAVIKLESTGVVETKLKKANGAPTLHYRPIGERLDELIFETIKPVDSEETSLSDSEETELTLDSEETEETINREYTKIPYRESWLLFLNEWKKRFPDKTQPKVGNKGLFNKWRIRILEPEFAQNWENVLLAASKSITLVQESWFQAEWILRNDRNWPRALANEWEWKDKQLEDQSKDRKKRSQSTAEKIRNHKGIR